MMSQPVWNSLTEVKELRQKIDAMEQRIKELERRALWFKNVHMRIARVLENAESSIWWLSQKAVRPGDRPVLPTEPLLNRLVPPLVDLPASLQGSNNGEIRELEHRCDELAQKMTDMGVLFEAAQKQIEAACDRLDVLEKKCLLPNERQDTPVKWRNMVRASRGDVLTTNTGPYPA